jgi:hypothetical protein
MILAIPLRQTKKLLNTDYNFPIVRIDSVDLTDMTCDLEDEFHEDPQGYEEMIKYTRKKIKQHFPGLKHIFEKQRKEFEVLGSDPTAYDPTYMGAGIFKFVKASLILELDHVIKTEPPYGVTIH